MVTLDKLEASLFVSDLGFTEGAVCFRYIEVGLRGRKRLFKRHGKPFGQGYYRLLVFKAQKKVVVFRAQFSRLQLCHDFLIFFVIFGGVFTECRLPVFVWSCSYYKLMLRMELDVETEFADRDVWARRALVLRLVY